MIQLFKASPLDFKLRVAFFLLAFSLIAYAGIRGDGGPLPMCPPCHPGGSKNCGPDCSLKDLPTPMILADGSDPMPLCRAKGCGPIKNGK